MATSEALRGRLQKDIDLKSNASKYYSMWRKAAHKIPTATNKNIQEVALHEGDWHDHGAIKIWNYSVGGKSEVFKERVEFDDENLSFTLHCIEGHVHDIYKVYRPSCKVIQKSNGCVAKLALDYERLNEDSPIPNHYMDFIVSVTEEIDTHAYAESTS